MFLRLLLIAWAFILLSTVASAEYKRKVIYPNFFVPQSALPKAEKLPPIKTGTYAKSEDKASQETPLPQQKSDTTISTTVQKSYTTLDKFENLPEYKHKYDDYINDLQLSYPILFRKIAGIGGRVHLQLFPALCATRKKKIQGNSRDGIISAADFGDGENERKIINQPISRRKQR